MRKSTHLLDRRAALNLHMRARDTRPNASSAWLPRVRLATACMLPLPLQNWVHAPAALWEAIQLAVSSWQGRILHCQAGQGCSAELSCPSPADLYCPSLTELCRLSPAGRGG